MTITALITQFFDRYCLESLNPAFAHVWVMVVEASAVTIAMYCLIQFYYQIKGDIAEHKPLLKVLAIKLVIFLSFWQTILISFLTSSGAVQPSKTIQTPDLRVGIPCMLLCIEMALFAIFHFWSFSYRPYILTSKNMMSDSSTEEPRKYVGGPLGLKAFIDSMNPWDMIKAIGRGARWVVVGRKHRHQDESYDVPLGRKPTEDSTPVQPAPFASTAYAGGNSSRFREHDDDMDTLLANQQRVGTARYESVPQRTEDRYDSAANIGMAATTSDDKAYEAYHAPTSSTQYEQRHAERPPMYSVDLERDRLPYQHQTYRPPAGSGSGNMF